MSEDAEDVSLETVLDILDSTDILGLKERSRRVGRQTKGSECQFINLLEVRSNQDCGSGSKFVVKQKKGIRKQFLILDGQVVLAFVQKKGGKFANCRVFEDITSNVKCKVTMNFTKN